MSGDIKRLHEYDAMSDKERRAEIKRLNDAFVHITPACDHDFQGWREFADGNGGETVCTKCGLGAMSWSLRTGL